MNNNELINETRSKYNKLKDKAGIDEAEALELAFWSALKEEVERPDVTPIQIQIAKIIKKYERFNRGPVSTKIICREHDLIHSLWSAWYHCRNLEKAGVAYKPGGKYSNTGYMLTERGRRMLYDG